MIGPVNPISKASRTPLIWIALLPLCWAAGCTPGSITSAPEPDAGFDDAGIDGSDEPQLDAGDDAGGDPNTDAGGDPSTDGGGDPIEEDGGPDGHDGGPEDAGDEPVGNVIQVGPARALTTPCAAAAVAQDGDLIEIDAGEYLGDVCAWEQNDLVLRGVGGFAHLRAAGAHAQGKAIWVIKGSQTTIEWVEFSEASVPDQNGAGIRLEGPGLTLRHCSFHDNENGILAGDNGQSDVLIEYTEFARNGFGDGYTHNLYINHVRSLTFRHNLSHHARIGHNLKSRALENFILYNRFADEADGTASYAIDLPNGGLSMLIGNLIQQGPNTDNSTLVSYGREGLSNPSAELTMVNNTLVNDRHTGTFVNLQAGSQASLINNLFVGDGTAVNGTASQQSDLQTNAPGFVDRAGFDYHLVAGSPAIDQGVDPGSANGRSLTPVWQYLAPADRDPRPTDGTLDLGAYER